MCARDDDPSFYDRIKAEEIRRAAITRDGTQLDTRPGLRQPGEIVNGIYTVVPAESVKAPGRPEQLSLYPSFIMVAGWHSLHGEYGLRPVQAWGDVEDMPSTWLAIGWLRFSLWARDDNADVYDAEMDLIPLLNKALHRWVKNCPECHGHVFSSVDLLDHLYNTHRWSLHTLEAWMRLVLENRIVLPEKGGAVDAVDGRID